jgi:acyl-CoA synthetase (AMP-forming)/AMP-acid ligase II
MNPMEYPDNIGSLLEAAAARFGPKKFFIIDHEGLSFSFVEMNARVNQYANALREVGICAGTHVSVMLPNCSEFPLTWLALAKLGAVMVPVNNRYQVRDLEYLLNDSDSTIFIIHAEYVPIFRQVSPQSHRLEKVLRVGPGHEDLGPSLPELAGSMPQEFSPDTHPGPDTVMNLQYTSGTTGFPKAAITTHEYWLVLGEFAARSIHEQDVFLTMSPFYYMDPQWELLMALFSGCSIVLVDKITLESFTRCIKQYPITACWAFPEMMYLTQFKEDRDHHLKFMMLGAFPASLHRELEDLFHVTAREVYGMTEIGAGAQAPFEDVHMVGSGSVGKPPDFRQLRIVNENGDDVPPGNMGELLVTGRGLFKGYYKKPDENTRAFLGEYFRTGDIFRQDQDGNYFFVSRKKDMIRRMGDNISATEVEHVLMSHPMISEAAVVAVPDKMRGEEVKAYILPALGETPASIPPQEIVAWCLERIAKFKVPRYIEYVQSFPRSASEKIQKNLLTGQKKDLTDGCYDRFAPR